MKSYWIVMRDHEACLERREIPVPQPGAGELLIKVHASALNRGELLVGGVMHGGPEKLGGNEASGTVDWSVWNGCEVGMSIFEYGKTKLLRLSALRTEALLRSGRLIGVEFHRYLPSTTGGLAAQPNTSSW